MMNEGFIKNEELLKESHEVDDLLGFSSETEQFKKKIDALNKPSILGLVGPFGIGKSTMLYQIQKSAPKKEKWINFDAWKYPDRQDLWEGFVLDFAKEISPEEFKVTEKKIKGEQNDDKKTLIKTLSRLPGFAVLEGLNHFFETSPARRVDEIQQILKNQIEKVDSSLYIVVEDVDRSGDSGVFFLETLKQFVSRLETSKKFIVIVPMSDTNYYDKLDSYLKSIDYFEFFQPTEINLEKFVNEVFDEALFTSQFNRKDDNKIIWTGTARRTQTVSFLEWLFQKHNEMSMRLLKLILRKANLVYINQIYDGHEPDFRVSLCIEASKYFSISKDSDLKYFDDFKNVGEVYVGNIFASFLIAMLWNKSFISEVVRTGRGEDKDMLIRSPGSFKFNSRKGQNTERHPSYPWEYDNFFSREESRKFGIASFYMEY